MNGEAEGFGQFIEARQQALQKMTWLSTIRATWRRRTRRQFAAAVGGAVAVAGIVALGIAVLLGTVTRSAAPVTGTVRPAGGPSAEQLAHGKWVSMPAALFRLCDPFSVWDGHSLVVVEPGVRMNG